MLKATLSVYQYTPKETPLKTKESYEEDKRITEIFFIDDDSKQQYSFKYKLRPSMKWTTKNTQYI